MKKIGIITLLIATLSISCSNSSDKQTIAGPGDEKTVKTSTSEVTGKPEHLTKETFKQKVMDYEKNPRQWVFEGDKPCIVDFYADWCKPCRMIAPILEELAAEYKGQINIYKVDSDEERELASVFGITSLPTLLFVPLQGNPSAQRGALSKDDYRQIIKEFLLKPATANPGVK